MKTVNQTFSTEGLPNTIVATLYDGPTTYLQQQVKNTYDAYDNIIEKDESDFDPCTGSPCPTNSSPTWLRKTYTTYASDAALINAHIVNKPSKIVVAYGDGTPVSLTSYTYDSRGNVLTEDKCLSISGLGSAASCSSAWETKFVHDTTGQVTQRIDGNGTSVAATTTYTWGLLANGFVTQVQHPNGANDFYTYYTQIGQVQTHTDWNSRTTNYAYADPLNRITSITAPQTVDGTTGANGSGITTYTYNDGAGGFSVQEQHKMDASGTMTSTTKYFDGLGRETGTITASPQCASGIHVDTVYDSMSRVYSVSNPYCSTSDPTYGTTIYQYDALGRKNQTTLPGGAVSLINYAGNATENTDPSNGTTSVQHIQQIDGLGRLIKVCEVSSAALGTDSSPSSCGLNISGSGYLTSYTYDPLGNMWSVNQHGLSRSFVYDSLSRLTQAMNPETGSSPDLYTYSTPGASCSPDPSVPCTRTDVRGVVTAYQYDSMSRLTGKSYSAGSGNTTGPISDLSSCYQYDTALSGVTDANPKGQLTAEWQQAGSCPSSAVTSLPPGAVAVRIRSQHDAVGRVGLDQQCLTGGSCSSTTGNFVYSYNLLGSPVQANNGIFAGTVSASQIGIPNSTTISAPSLTWKTTYDSAPHLAQVFIQDQPGTSQFPVASTGAAFSSFPTLLKAISYDPFDHMTIGQLGIPYGSSTPPLSISRQYDVRGRIQNEADQGMLTSSPSSGSTGSITISGSEQSQQQQTQAATQSSASITISGSGRSKKVYDSGCNCFDWVTDGGDVEVTVNGFVGYGSYGAVTDTPTIVAASLASSLNRSGSPVTATYSGPTVTLTSKATGAAVNYSLSYASNYDDNYWSTPAFTFTTAPSAMSGGHDATYTTGYDSGTVSATINSHTATVSWGNGSSSSTIASALASAISSTDSSFLTATSSGGVVNLASLGTGSTTNWSIQVSVTYDTAHFSSSSFTASPSGMAGGSDSGATYGAIYSYQVPAGGYAPNGNILQHSDSVMGTWSFGYDAVDRLTSSHQTASTSTSTQYGNMYGCWSYDTRGNRTSEAISTTNCTSSPTPQNVTAYSANNQISSSTLSPNTLASGSFIYDASGNTLYDGNNEYWYDAEGQLCAVQSLRYGAGTVYQYAYDPEGARIAKGTMSTAPAAFTKIGASLGSSPTCAPPSGSNFVPTTRYLVDLSGQQVTELNLTTGQWQHSNIFAGGKLVATYDLKGIHFGLTDPLGTKRVQANAQGQVDQQCTGLPFGNDVNNPPSVNCAQTTNGLQTNGDATEHHFTQKERDSETGNDYFFARYYTAALGRFTTPDWSAKVTPVPYAVFTDPQSLNLYAYVRNNPLTHADRDGHLDCSGKNAQGVGCVYQAAWNVVHGTINNATMQVLSYFYAKGGNGEGIGVNDIKVGPVRFDFVHRVKGEDVTRTTDGKTVEKVIQEDGFKVGVEQLKIGLSKTTTQVGGEKPKTEWVRGFDFGKFEGENAEIGLGWGGCMIRCGQIGIGIRADRVVEDISTFLKNNPADPNDPILLSPK
jgi:RHS repeat-associated protein